ncbi:hypothetical protein ACF0H5_019724 [Mactra antiquata]
MWSYEHCIVCFIFVLCVVINTGLNGKDSNGLKCYACYGIGPNNECEDYENYRAAREDDETDGPVKLKDCSAPFNVSCMIETFKNDKGDIVHIRDCSDDKTFDFTEILTNASTYRRLLELEDNNETACAWDNEQLVCLSKCAPQSVNDTADFCNGPQFGSAFTSSVSMFTILLSCVMVPLWWILEL